MDNVIRGEGALKNVKGGRLCWACETTKPTSNSKTNEISPSVPSNGSMRDDFHVNQDASI